MANQGLSAQEIGKTYHNVYHLMLPYVIGDTRITYIPVYIFNSVRTSLSLSKSYIKIGDYIYPSNSSLYNPFYLSNGCITNCSNISLYDNKRFKIGNNVFDFNSVGYLYKSNDIISPIDIKVNRYSNRREPESNFTGINSNSIDFNNLVHNEYGNMYGKISYVIASNITAFSVDGNIINITSGGNISIPINATTNSLTISGSYGVFKYLIINEG